MFDETREELGALGYPDRDPGELPASPRGFSDGGQYKIEIATVNTIEAAETVLDYCHRANTRINKITHTSGISFMTDQEISEFVALARERDIELVMSPGPRGVLDIGAQVKVNSVAAHAGGYRLRGTEQLVYAIEDVKRAVALGCRGINCWDEGLLQVLSALRTQGKLPADLHLKASASMGVSNPVHCRIIEKLGADSINLQRDLPLNMIASIRAGVEVPLDIHSDNPAMSGGFMRLYEVPEFVRIAAPVNIKGGNSAFPAHDMKPSPEQALQMAKLIVRIEQIIRQYYPEAIQAGTAS